MAVFLLFQVYFEFFIITKTHRKSIAAARIIRSSICSIMLEYPSEIAKNKHDLICFKESISGTALQDAFGFENTGAIFQALAQEIPKGLTTLANVYSYHDAPDPPLSRSLIVIGVADTSLSIVRKLVGEDGDDDFDGDDAAMTPDCPLHKCLVAVKRADGHH